MKVLHYVTAPDRELCPMEPRAMGDTLPNALVLHVEEKPWDTPYLGIGVAITGSSCWHLNRMPEEQRTSFLRNIYGSDGLHLNVARLTVGASDYSPEAYTYDDGEADPELKNFSIDRDRAYVLPMIREAVAVNPELFLFSSPWSPPGWMKTGGKIGGGYMRDKYVDAYVEYYIRFLKAYEAEGVHIQALTPQNEPETDQQGQMPACRWNPDTEAKFISRLYKRLREENMDTKIWMFDHSFEGWNRVRWMLHEYPELQRECDAAAFHYYDDVVEKLDFIREEFPDFRFHFTEGGPRLLDHYATDHCKWAMMIAKAFRHGCRSLTGWNLLLDEKGSPNLGPFFCGGLATVNSETGDLTYSGQYKAMGHFTRFAERGAILHESRLVGDGRMMFGYNNEQVYHPVESCVLRNPDGREVVVLVNANSGKRLVQYYRGGKWWFVEMLPDSVSTLVFEE